MSREDFAVVGRLDMREEGVEQQQTPAVDSSSVHSSVDICDNDEIVTLKQRVDGFLARLESQQFFKVAEALISDLELVDTENDDIKRHGFTQREEIDDVLEQLEALAEKKKREEVVARPCWSSSVSQGSDVGAITQREIPAETPETPETPETCFKGVTNIIARNRAVTASATTTFIGAFTLLQLCLYNVSVFGKVQRECTTVTGGDNPVSHHFIGAVEAGALAIVVSCAAKKLVGCFSKAPEGYQSVPDVEVVGQDREQEDAFDDDQLAVVSSEEKKSCWKGGGFWSACCESDSDDEKQPPSMLRIDTGLPA